MDDLTTMLIAKLGGVTVSVPTAGREIFGLGRNASYEAAKRGDIPTFRIGRKLVVPVPALARRLGADAASWQQTEA